MPYMSSTSDGAQASALYMMMPPDAMHDGHLKHKSEEGGMAFSKGYPGAKDGWSGESCVLMPTVAARPALTGCVC